jgi:D-3-phosphoglycerate dehydrogenase
MKFLITDYQTPDTNLERRMIEDAGHQVIVAQCQTPEDVIQAGHGADAMIASYAPITHDVFENLPNIQCVSTLGVGVDHVDIEAARNKGIWVANVPDSNFTEVASTALAMTLSLVRHLPFLHDSVRRGTWDYAATGPMRRPAHIALGIVGMGRIGRQLATIAKPVFGQIFGHDPYLSPDNWPSWCQRMECQEVFERSDIVSLHLPLTDDNKQFVDHGLLNVMRRGSYLVNIARGGLVNVETLVEFLDSGHIAGAALDVLPIEPPIPNDPVLTHPRMIVTPHSAFYSIESEEEGRCKAVMNLLAWAECGRPTYPVLEGRSKS